MGPKVEVSLRCSSCGEAVHASTGKYLLRFCERDATPAEFRGVVSWTVYNEALCPSCREEVEKAT